MPTSSKLCVYAKARGQSCQKLPTRQTENDKMGGEGDRNITHLITCSGIKCCLEVLICFTNLRTRVEMLLSSVGRDVCQGRRKGVLTVCGTNMHMDIHYSVCTEMLHIMSPLCACGTSSCTQVNQLCSCTEMCIISHWCQAAMCHIAQEGIVTWCANSHVHLQSCVFAYSNCALPYQSSLRDSANLHEILLHHRRQILLHHGRFHYITGDSTTSQEILLYHRRYRYITGNSTTS